MVLQDWGEARSRRGTWSGTATEGLCGVDAPVFRRGDERFEVWLVLAERSDAECEAEDHLDVTRGDFRECFYEGVEQLVPEVSAVAVCEHAPDGAGIFTGWQIVVDHYCAASQDRFVDPRPRGWS